LNAPAELLRACADLPAQVRAHFLAQCAHESNAFTATAENLNYSAASLQRTWPARFNAVSAREYARQPERIANRVYANRMGNGDEASGDGWRFRGQGYIQLTGRANVARFSLAHFGDDRLLFHPELLRTPAIAAAAARWFWDDSKLTPLALRDDIRAITQRINGGLNGLSDRIEWLERFRAQLAAVA
jgi:putative chitinase